MSSRGLKTEVTDNTINRYRPTVLISDENMVGNVGKQRAEWERQRNNAEGKQMSATVQGWTKADGSLWLPNESIKLNAPELGIYGEELLVVDCTYTLDENGTLTVMKLMHRNAFDEPAEALASKTAGKKKSGKSSGIADADLYDNTLQES